MVKTPTTNLVATRGGKMELEILQSPISTELSFSELSSASQEDPTHNGFFDFTQTSPNVNCLLLGGSFPKTIRIHCLRDK